MKNRIITAIILMAILLPLAYFSEYGFKLLVLLLILNSTMELLEVKKDNKYHLITNLLFYFSNAIVVILISFGQRIGIFHLACLLIIYMIILIIDKNINFSDLCYIGFSSFYILIAASFAIYFREQTNGFAIILYIIFVGIASDTGAYFVGTRFGKHKLIERISPKKSVEGLIGGVVLALIVGIVYCLIFNTGIRFFVLTSLCLGLGAVLGDLFLSALKRNYNIKDFSNLLPGHGGILDRIDSHLANFIIFFVLYTLLN